MNVKFESVVTNTMFRFNGRSFKKVTEVVNAGKVYNAICVDSPHKDEMPSAWVFDSYDEVETES